MNKFLLRFLVGQIVAHMTKGNILLLLDRLEDAIEKSENEIDDQIALPVVGALRKLLTP